MKNKYLHFYFLSLKSSETGTTVTSLMQNSTVTQPSTRKLFPFMPRFTRINLLHQDLPYQTINQLFQTGSTQPSPIPSQAQWAALRMDLLNYCNKHRRNKSQLSFQAETSPNNLQHSPLLLDHSSTPVWDCEPSPAQWVPPCSQSPGVMLHLGQPCPKGTV